MRLASIWIPVILASICSFLCFVTAREIGADYNYQTGRAEVPVLSKLYYPDAVAVYFYPVVFGAWAAYATIKKVSQDHALLMVTAAFASMIAFTVGWICGMVLPYTSILVRPISG